MRHKLDEDTPSSCEEALLDHGSRHAGMPHRLENCFIPHSQRFAVAKSGWVLCVCAH
jgi:hypothetical protein